MVKVFNEKSDTYKAPPGIIGLFNEVERNHHPMTMYSVVSN
jgi:hypothetical protein